MLKLYSYYRSSASYRVRIALNLKGIPYEYAAIHLLNDGGQHNSSTYRQINPMSAVPAIDHDGFVLAESLAIIQYLDDVFDEKPLLPAAPKAKAKVLQLCEAINSGIQPLQNLKVVKALEEKFGLSSVDSKRWSQHWIETGFNNLERMLEQTAGQFAFGNELTAVDCLLVPQCFTARRFAVNVENYPMISRIEKALVGMDAFKKAHPDHQPDTPKS